MATYFFTFYCNDYFFYIFKKYISILVYRTSTWEWLNIHLEIIHINDYMWLALWKPFMSACFAYLHINGCKIQIVAPIFNYFTLKCSWIITTTHIYNITRNSLKVMGSQNSNMGQNWMQTWRVFTELVTYLLTKRHSFGVDSDSPVSYLKSMCYF